MVFSEKNNFFDVIHFLSVRVQFLKKIATILHNIKLILKTHFYINLINY